MLSEWFDVRGGVRQGCVIAPMLVVHGNKRLVSDCQRTRSELLIPV
jgi:hypothetical protein